MKQFDLSELNLEEYGAWPLSVKILVVVLSCALLIFAAYYIDTRSQSKTLVRFERKEVSLRKIYAQKYHQAVNLTAYQTQLETMRKMLSGMLHQLPSKTEVPALLEDISALGQKNGLKFSLFKPMKEKQYAFYSALPINMEMTGTYHDLAIFVSDIAALDRIVTIQNFKIMSPADAGKATKNTAPLRVILTANTYRYLK